MGKLMNALSKRTLTAAIVAMTLMAAACGSDDSTSSSSGTGQPSVGGEADTMVWAIQAPPASMDLAKASDVPTQRVQTAAFDRLLSVDNDGVVVPWIATKFENPDPLTWVFTIRDDVKFWDGTPLTTADVAYSISRHTGDSTSVVAFNFFTIDSVVATDEATVTVTLNTVDPSLPAKMALFVPVIQEQYSVAAGDELGGPSKPGMGTGPYSITSYSSANGAVLTRNDSYWAGKPKVKTLEFKVISDPDTARLALSGGEIDGYFDVPLIATRQWDTLENATMSYVTGAYNDMLTMDVTRAPFDDVNVRIAMAHLIDRDDLLSPLFNGKATVASTIVPATQMTSSYGADGAAAIYAEVAPVPEFSIDEAKAALAASGHSDGFTVDLPVDTTQPWMSPLAQNLAENAKQLGITINVVPVSAADWVAGLTDPAASPLQLLALGAGTPWPGELPPVIAGTNGGFNVARYAGAEIDALVGDVTLAGTLDELKAPLTELLVMMGDDLPYIPLFDEQTAVAISNDFVWEGGYSYWALGQAWPLSLGAAG
jgi:peptide/nickel transport system substrate-binding protein